MVIYACSCFLDGAMQQELMSSSLVTACRSLKLCMKDSYKGTLILKDQVNETLDTVKT